MSIPSIVRMSQMKKSSTSTGMTHEVTIITASASIKLLREFCALSVSLLSSSGMLSKNERGFEASVLSFSLALFSMASVVCSAVSMVSAMDAW